MSDPTNGATGLQDSLAMLQASAQRVAEQLRAQEETICQLRAELQAAQQANDRLREERDRNRVYFEELARELFAPPGSDLHERMAAGLTFDQFLKAVGAEAEDAA